MVGKLAKAKIIEESAGSHIDSTCITVVARILIPTQQESPLHILNKPKS